MSAGSHNKKRNVGLIYEFLVMTISRALVEGNSRLSASALRLVKRHFRPGTELYKEYRLINSLLRTTVSTEATAASILTEAKAAARRHDVPTLDREKSLLISSINKQLGGGDFYEQHVNEYRTLATIQTLLNDWRSGTDDLRRLGEYEDRLVKWLLAEKAANPDTAVSDEQPGTARLMMRVMMKRLNERYAGVLNADQKQLLRAYAFSMANDNQASVRLKLQETRDRVVAAIDACCDVGSEYVGNKLADVRAQVADERLDEVNDETMTRFMLYAKLMTELVEGR